jgi:hypothetical protein
MTYINVLTVVVPKKSSRKNNFSQRRGRSTVLNLVWKPDGGGLVLLANRRKSGRVIPDPDHPEMFRAEWRDGHCSDLTNLTRAKDALVRFLNAPKDKSEAAR